MSGNQWMIEMLTAEFGAENVEALPPEDGQQTIRVKISTEKNEDGEIDLGADLNVDENEPEDREKLARTVETLRAGEAAVRELFDLLGAETGPFLNDADFISIAETESIPLAKSVGGAP